MLKLKQRSVDKGLILIASHYEQLLPYIDESAVTQEQKQIAFDSWPGPNTWIFPKNINTPDFLTGKYHSIAVRITDHPLVCQLCDLFAKREFPDFRWSNWKTFSTINHSRCTNRHNHSTRIILCKIYILV